ncbi:MAG TPA: glycosyl hydrolase 115 family protein, partial [Rhodanobacteraceae bacterium]|nr:glycosyl hydrolase 115 family protein [Rhodanobacteraceae bacterium]
MALIDAGKPATILADAADFPGVLRAARDLQGDLSAVAGSDATLSTDANSGAATAIIVGTLGHSARVDRIVREKHIDVGAVAGRWEAYLLQVVEHPEPGVARALLIAGADKRGTIFGIYELSRRLGVSPWTWWADVPIARRAAVHIAPGRCVDAPAVRYRGIFINDEDPALGGWMKATYGGPNHEFYARVFELILRLKGNLLWPAMWGRAFADDDAQSPVLADDYGVVIGTSHHEPMMRAHVEWKRYGKGPWKYDQNRDELRAFWHRGIERMDGHESIVTLGMRGDGDEPMTQGTAIDLLERIVADQRGMLSETTGRPAERTPQVWALYKEVQDYFDAGMRVPDDVTLLFSDDNWGNLRRVPKLGEKRTGGYGIYYHFDYVGGPRNYKWINTNQIERVWDQMQLARAYGADSLWIVNVGDIKPMEFPISFFLDQAWNPDAMSLDDLQAYPSEWAAEQFGAGNAPEIGAILTRYTQYNARRKPELLAPDTYSLANFGEADRVLGEWNALVERTQRIGATLPAAYRDAWYELVAYPVLASANLNAMYVAAARNRLFAAQGRREANDQAAEVARLFARDTELARAYEHDIARGKWIHMMSQTHIGYTGWQQPETNVAPETKIVSTPAESASAEVVATKPAVDDAIAGTNAASGDTVEEKSGGATRSENSNAIRAGSSSGRDHAVGAEARASATAYGERDGVIAIEAAHYARAVATNGIRWRTIPNLGRTLSGVKALPDIAPPQEPGGKGPRLEYPIRLDAAGEVDVRVVLSPTLDFLHRGGLRFAVSIGDEPPQIVTMKLDPTPGSADFAAWEKAVSDNAYAAVSHHHVAAGAQTLKLWRVDPGVV